MNGGEVGGRRRRVEKRDRFAAASIAIDRSRGARSLAIAIYPLLTVVRARTAAGNRINIQTKQGGDGQQEGEGEDEEEKEEERRRGERRRSAHTGRGGWRDVGTRSSYWIFRRWRLRRPISRVMPP